MRELLFAIQNWFDAELEVALATVVKVYGSAPRGLGAKMAINQMGVMAGSVSGGCVEGAVVAESLQVLKSKKPVLITYGVSDEQAFSVGLACGGIIEVFIEPLTRELFQQFKLNLLAERLFARAVVISGDNVGKWEMVSTSDDIADKSLFMPVGGNIKAHIKDAMSKQLSTRFTMEKEGNEQEVFLDVLAPREILYIVGAVHIAIPLVNLAKILGFYTVVIDPRKAFSNLERFPNADELIIEWPDEYLSKVNLNEGSYVAVISHDEKLDVPALAVACTSQAHYIGSLGSKKTFMKNKQGLLDRGVSPTAVERIHNPIGLSIAARGPEEIALAIITQVVAVKNGVGAA